MKQAEFAEVLAEAKQGGGDYAELYLEDTEVNTVELTGGTVEKAGYTRLRGAGVVFFDGTLWTDDEIVRAGLGSDLLFIGAAELQFQALIERAHLQR